MGGRDFNHMTTGFILSGGHAVAACETCHIGGVFKGTPRACDGCHAVGKRIIATPKTNSHIVTDAQCDSCHFNSATWLGARYNHGTAKVGDCATCHNARIAEGKHGAHVVTTYSCDQCHRTSSWVPASWNHSNNALATYSGQSCKACHIPTGLGKNKIQSGAHITVDGTGVVSLPGAVTVSDCVNCHSSYFSFNVAYWNHAGAPTTCDSCHGTYTTPGIHGVRSPTTQIHSAIGTVLPGTTCSGCHKSFGSFSGARFDHVGATSCDVCHSGSYASAGIKGKPSSHISFAAPATQCGVCHTTTSWSSMKLTGASLHTYMVTPLNTAPHTPTCRSCHSNRSHDGKDGANSGMDCSRSGCHKPAGGEGSSYTKW
jgi:hypothetical protein